MPNLYRTALQVSPERIAALDEQTLNVLMRELLLAQAYLAGADRAEVVVNTEGRARDDGSDGVSPAPSRPDPWLGETETVWQFKAGGASEPARLTAGHEVRKQMPKAVLQRGGRFVVVASGSNSGDPGEQRRRDALVADAEAVGIPSTRIVVWGSESLTTWCNQHPAIAARLAGRPEGLCQFVDWARSDEHDVEWQAVDALSGEIVRLRADLDLETGRVPHVHVFGHPGVGKTRFALELCRSAPWQSFVVYVRQAADVRVSELLDSCAAERDVRLVLVVDEVEAEQISILRDSVARSDGRVRLVTIGPSPSPDPDRVPSFEVKPLPEQVILQVVRRLETGIPFEHAEFVARFSDGYMRLARLAAKTVRRNPDIDVRRMLEQPHIRSFLDKMLGDGDRGSLHVLAVLSSVGWTDEREMEGKAIAEHLGLDWSRVRREVDAFDRLFHIAPRSGRLRNISPTPLGVYLALEAWTIYRTELRTLTTVLPEVAVDSYYERLQALASTAQAGAVAREELDRFFSVADLNDPRAIRRWSALAYADPMMAASRMRGELSRRSIEERVELQGPARHLLVGGLVALSWGSSTFEDAVHALALLAEAENDTVASNATSEFLQRFSIFFSGTAVPYAVRVQVLDALMSSERLELRRLAFRALARVAARQGFRTHRQPIARGLPEPEWQPTTNIEHIEAGRLGLERMRTAVEKADVAFQDVAGSIVSELRMLLLQEAVRTQVIDLFAETAHVFPSQRELIRRTLADLLFDDRKYWHKLGVDGETAVEELVARLEDRSLAGSLRQHVGPGSRVEDEPKIRKLATELAADAGTLATEWPWLTSGDGRGAWTLGDALGTTDLDRLIGELVGSSTMGRDGRIVFGYLRRRTEDEGDDWLDDWLDELWRMRHDRADLVLEATWRLTPTARGAQRVITLIDAGAGSSAVLAQFAYGNWEEKFDPAVLRTIVESLARRSEGAGAALEMVGRRLRKHLDELDAWSDLALALVTNGSLIRGTHHDSWEWKELANLIVGRFPREIYRAILHEQGSRGGQHWFLEHELAAEIVAACVDKDPAGMWEETRPYLERGRAEVLIFAVGFPAGLVDKMDHEAVLRWVAEEPAHRAVVIPRFVAKHYGDETLAGRLIERYGADEEVAAVFGAELMTDSWVGSSADHWAGIARSIRDVSQRARGAGLRRWAARYAEALEEMAARDRQREEEQRVR